jgi:potassium-transporting ATPase potassium-binding subunit
MNGFDFIQIFIFFTVLFVLSPFLGIYMAYVFENKKTFISGILNPLEKFIYKISGIDTFKEMDWKEYTKSLLIFNFIGFAILFIILLFQNILPLNPQHLKGMSWHLALNTAVSFMTNTNWQSYSGESTLSYFSQMIGLTVQNFLSAATGITVLVVLIRGLKNKESKNLGNFWKDMIRSILYILLPLSIILAVFLSSQGVVQTFSQYISVKTLEGKEQIIPLGPAASQIAIKQIGSNGGGFFGTNSAHPLENPTPFTNFLEMLAILLIPVSLLFTFGKMIGSKKQALTLFSAMLILLAISLSVMLFFEYQKNPVTGIAGSMEGKETRFGITNSILWAEITTSTSNGSVNSMHDGFSPLTGMMALINLMLGEIKFGGVGCGLYGMLMFVIITVFIAGLMVGRTPEYLGKKIEKKEVQMAMISIIAPSFVILVFSALAAVSNEGISHLTNKGPHGLSEILYAFSSAAANNGSAFAGLDTNNVFYNILISIGMLIGRFGIIIPVMAVAGSMSLKKIMPESTGTFKTDRAIFVVLLIAVIVIVVALNFVPALCLGPIIEHLLMLKGITF